MLRKKIRLCFIETVIVAGLIIGLETLPIASFQTSANGVTAKTFKQVNGLQNTYNYLTASE